MNQDNNAEYSKCRVSLSLLKRVGSEIKDVALGGQQKTHLLPWNPIISLEKEFKRNYSSGDWELRLRLYTRGKLATTYLQDYSVLIQVIDVNNNASVYSTLFSEMGKRYDLIQLKIAA